MKFCKKVNFKFALLANPANVNSSSKEGKCQNHTFIIISTDTCPEQKEKLSYLVIEHNKMGTMAEEKNLCVTQVVFCCN